MTIKRLFYILLVSLSLTACNTMPGFTGTDNTQVSSGFGTVESVEVVDRNNPGILGAIGGAVVGGLIGNQIGSGSGNTAATIAGAAGGAIAGREVERRVRTDDIFKIYVRMDDGTYQAIAQESSPILRPGDRVRVENGVVTPI
ncbi:MAG: glycine zipper 2TM domain-containing protein [Burkholderiales bacterium]